MRALLQNVMSTINGIFSLSFFCINYFSPRRGYRRVLKRSYLAQGVELDGLVPPKSYFFCDLKPHTKFLNRTITTSGRKVSVGEREEKNAVNSGHLDP